ncbi:hypothetical protein [Vibrio nigripulchritudo]|uniref:hypothetical protein n=1 Tax=Vibrio nigripulchritudo TaxID=28173 RepID=UPI0012D3D434|nr:hypothetical protein [Vibrio nigripulchritudo]
MPVSSIHSGHVILQQSRTMAKQATEELNEEARLERVRLEEVAAEERIRESQPNEEVQAFERAEEARETELAKEEQAEVYEESFNKLPTADEERDIKREEIASERQDRQESDYVEAATKLNQAKSYNSVGASVVTRSNDMIGTMLDISV